MWANPWSNMRQNNCSRIQLIHFVFNVHLITAHRYYKDISWNATFHMNSDNWNHHHYSNSVLTCIHFAINSHPFSFSSFKLIQVRRIKIYYIVFFLFIHIRIVLVCRSSYRTYTSRHNGNMPTIVYHLHVNYTHHIVFVSPVCSCMHTSAYAILYRHCVTAILRFFHSFAHFPHYGEMKMDNLNSNWQKTRQCCI